MKNNLSSSPPLRELMALTAIPDKLELGPHAKALIDELIEAARSEHFLSVIILSAALVDVLSHEGAERMFNSGEGLSEEEEDSFGLSLLRADERQALDRLRAMRNRILHYQGPSEGLTGHPSDRVFLKEQADAALAAILPLLELQEMV